ncbi:MAG: gliding motility protein GldM [Bacteroidales bacterium]|nr:gliding motility protein GldM [Bacteroidales bacterium]
MGANTTRLSPRQKMINLMYIVLTAMLALNVSSDVLDGFTQVHDGLNRSNSNVDNRNEGIYNQISDFAAINPEKGQMWLDKATEVRDITGALYAYVDSLKYAIVRAADGKNGDPNNIISRDDLEAASVTMLAPGTMRGTVLRHRIDTYRQYIAALMPDSVKQANIMKALSTDPIPLKGTLTPQQWEEAQFDQKPTVAAITLLTKLQNDILYAEGEALGNLYSQIDAGDVRVNEINAFVIPQSRIVMRGGTYAANIVLAAVDTTQRPTIFINDKELGDQQGMYQIPANSTGTFDYTGYLQVQHGDGTTTRHDFTSSYTVIEPMATVSATMMNVLYAGINNPISISVPGVPMSGISATMTNGTLTREGDHWIAKPQTVGTDAVLTVTAQMDGRSTNVANQTFRVRKLPDPTAYFTFTDQKGQTDQYKGGKPIAKALIMGVETLEAAIDDGLIDTKFNVISFQTVMFDSMGNAIPQNSDGARFSAAQKQQIQRLTRGKRFYISSIKASGPDGTTRDLSPMEVLVN